MLKIYGKKICLYSHFIERDLTRERKYLMEIKMQINLVFYWFLNDTKLDQKIIFKREYIETLNLCLKGLEVSVLAEL